MAAVAVVVVGAAAAAAASELLTVIVVVAVVLVSQPQEQQAKTCNQKARHSHAAKAQRLVSRQEQFHLSRQEQGWES